MIARMRTAALVLITALIALAALTSFAESYRALVIWAHEHHLSGIWAAAFPLQLDVFIAVGELALFVALADRWPARSRIGAWLVVGAGLAVCRWPATSATSWGTLAPTGPPLPCRRWPLPPPSRSGWECSSG